jgi:TP901 family phage tail tape measure protein
MAAKVGNVVVNFITNTAAFEKDIKKISRSLKDIGRDFTEAGRSLTMGLTAPIVAAGAAVFKFGTGFETAFAGVVKTVSATSGELEGLRSGIRKMSTEIPVAATELARIAEAAGQLGIETKNIMSFTRVMADLGVATNMSSEQAATSLARLANITQMPQEQFDRLGSTIVALGNNFATTESEIVDMSLRLAGAGATVKMSEAQILAFATALSSVGIEAEAGGSAISKIFIQIASEVSNAGSNLSTFASVAGMSVADFSRAFKDDAASAVSAFISGLGKIDKSGGNTLAVIEQLGITEVRMRDALLRTSGASKLLTDALSLGAEEWEKNNALTQEAEKFYATTSNQLKMLANRLMDVAVTLFDSLKPAIDGALPALKEIVNSIKDAAKWFADLPEGIRNTTVKVIALTAAIGPLLWGIGAVAKELRSILPLAVKLTGAVTGLGGAFASLSILTHVRNLGDLRAAVSLLAGEIGLLGTAAITAGIAFAGWKIGEWIDQMDLFGRHARVAENEIIKQAAALKQEAIDIGLVKDAMSKYQDMLDKGVITQGTFNSVLRDLTDQRPNESLKQYAARLADVVAKYREAHPELAKLKTGMEEGANATNKGANAIGNLADVLDDAKASLEAFNASYFDSFKGAENIPRAPWDRRIIDLELYLGKLREVSLAENSALVDAARVEGPDLGITFTGWGDLDESVQDVTGAFEDLGRAQARNTESMSQFGQVVSTTLTNATQTIAEKVTAWMGPVRHFAKAALAALMEGLFNPLFKILTAVGNAIGTWLTGAMGGMLGGAGNAMSFSGLLKSAIGIGGSVGLGAIGGGAAMAQTGATLGAGMAGAGPVAIGGGTAAAAGGGSAAFLAGLAAVAPYAALAIPATFGVMELVKWAQGPNSYQAGAKEVKRDYGLNMSQKDIAAFFSSVGVSEPEAWDQRAPLLMSPQFQQFAIARGQTSDFSKFGPEWEAAYEKAMIGKWGDYNELFLNEYANKQPGAFEMEDWYDRLTIPNQSGQSAQSQQQSVNIRGGDMNLTVNISGSGNELVNIVRSKVIPILQQEMRRGSTGLRESIAASVRATAGAY